MTLKLTPKPVTYASRSALSPSPLSELTDSVRAILENRIQRGLAAFAEDFKGITVDGDVQADLFKIASTGVSTQPMIEAAKAFLATLSAGEREKVSFEIDSVEWRKWSNAHPFLFRHGTCLHHLAQTQRDAALALLQESLSEHSYQAARNVMKLSHHLLELTGRPEEHGEWHYFISMFGEPSCDEPWGWQIDGHHLNISCFVLGDQVVLTPHLVGAEPMVAESGIYAGTRVLKEEEAAGHALMNALTPAQRAKATIGQKLPRELFTTAPWDNYVMRYEGIRYDELTYPQKALLLEIARLYAGRMRAGHAEMKIEEINRHLDETYFAWIGPVDDESPFYYRVHSPVTLIEFVHQRGVAFDNEEPTRNHAHGLIRTPNGNDYGRALLRAHQGLATPFPARPSNHKTGTVRSGDVDIFYRRFGKPGLAPILIFHGAQYFDSADWIDVAAKLASDREVVAFDARGYGKSTWSPNKDYSIDAAVRDALALVDHFGWQKTVWMGHSRGGGFAILMAARFPERTTGLIVVDRPLHTPIGHASPDGKPSVGHKPQFFPTYEAAVSNMSRDKHVPPGSAARRRLDEILKPVDGGFMIAPRDPDYNNTIPIGTEGCQAKFLVDDLYEELARVMSPALIIRGSKSDRYPPQSLGRLSKEFPHIPVMAVDSDHDVAVGAPEELVGRVMEFLADRIDNAARAVSGLVDQSASRKV
jgi:pimeloyl-ACP methyl ester carboxylesterase